MIRFIEYLLTRQMLSRAHAITPNRAEQGAKRTEPHERDSVAATGRTGPHLNLLNTVQGTSPTINPETEPHQPRVGTGKSAVGRDGIETRTSSRKAQP